MRTMGGLVLAAATVAGVAIGGLSAAGFADSGGTFVVDSTRDAVDARR